MYQGVCPEASFNGEPLKPSALYVPGRPLFHNLRFRLTEIRGDWKHHQQVWGLVRAAFTSNNVCHCCQASRSDASVSMLDFSAQPRWAATIRSHATFINEIMSSPGCNLIFVRKFHYSMIRWCSMHCVQLGVAQFLNGGCWFELTKVSWFPGQSETERFRGAYRKFKTFLRLHKIKQRSQPVFKPWMYVSTGEESCTLRAKAPKIDLSTSTLIYMFYCYTLYLYPRTCAASYRPMCSHPRPTTAAS